MSHTPRALASSAVPGPYQLLPALSVEAFAALKADIEARGVLVPVELDENGALLDGHHRMRACAELGITRIPRIVRRGLSETDKIEHVLKLNLLRRHLGPVAWADSFTQLAASRGVRLGSGPQAAKTATVAVLAREVGVTDRTARHRLQVAAAVADDPLLAARVDAGDVSGKEAIQQKRNQRRAENRRDEMEEARRQPHRVVSIRDDRCSLELGDARHLPLADGSVDFWLGSPPYNAGKGYRGYLDRLSWCEYWDGLIVPAFSEVARVLAPGGRAAINLANVVHCPGEPWPRFLARYVWPLMEAVQLLPREHLTWVKARDPEEITSESTAWGTWRSAANPVCRAVAEPIYVVSKDTYDREPRGGELLDRERFLRLSRNVWYVPYAPEDQVSDHPAKWPVQLAADLIAFYSFPDDLVVDSFLGSGSSAVAAVREDRRFYGVDVSADCVAEASVRVAAAVDRPRAA
jgi:modification methylase